MKTHVLCAAFVIACVTPLTARAAPKPDVPALARARADAAAKVYAGLTTRYQTGAIGLDALVAWSVRWYDAERDAATKPADAKLAADNHVARVQQLAKLVELRFQHGDAASDEVASVQYFLAEAQYWQAKATP